MSREIDARVAREVMGVKPESFGAGIAWATPIKPYSTDMNAAMEVVTELAKRRLPRFRLQELSDQAVHGLKWGASFGFPPTVAYGAADTPALAICLAALDALQNE